MQSPRMIIISAPSGTGKSSVIEKLMSNDQLKLSFSISATNRAPRGNEQNGKEYFFISDEEFQKRINEDAFIEYVEVYEGRYYGTLKSELNRIHESGRNMILDIDVEGALKVKEKYGSQVLAIFLAPPSLQELRRRLETRGTDTQEVIEQRLKRAEYELSLQNQFDKVFVNDDLQKCSENVEHAIAHFLFTK